MLTITWTTRAWEGRALWLVGGLSLAIVVAVLVVHLVTGRSISVFSVLPLLAGVLPGLLSHLTRPRTITMSAEGILWCGPGWDHRRTWDDVVDVGILRPSQGVGATWIAARLRADAAPASRFLMPRRLRRLRVDPTRDLAGLVLIQHPWGDPPEWDASDDDIVAAIREHVGDRWTEPRG